MENDLGVNPLPLQKSIAIHFRKKFHPKRTKDSKTLVTVVTAATFYTLETLIFFAPVEPRRSPRPRGLVDIHGGLLGLGAITLDDPSYACKV